MSTQATTPPRVAGNGAHSAHGIDWQAAERSPEFRELIRRKRRFVVPATIFFFTWYFGFILLAGYAEGFMGESIYEGFTVGYALALSQFVMTWVLGAWYLRRAGREWDSLEHRAAERAVEQRDADLGPRSPMGISRPERGNGREEVAR